jgi:predicted RNA-binding Zn ribbon-like protein
VAGLNRLALASAAVVQLVEDEDGRWRLSVRGKHPLAALCAFGLLEGIREFGYSRFGICSGAPCRCVYVDRSRARARRYCSELCADRVNQARYRSRRRTRA